jgi:formylmethanofuran dehydrogenase subunit B
MDGVPIRMRKVVDPPKGVLSDVEILSKILSKVKEKRGWV